eukprot:gene10335-19162_t
MEIWLYDKVTALKEDLHKVWEDHADKAERLSADRALFHCAMEKSTE